jgi:RNA polymerase sigma-70 factor (ECF subfamily)
VDGAERAQLQAGLVRLLDGDRTAFASVYASLWPVFLGMARRQLPSVDAEDVAQEALVKLFARISEFDPERDALSWSLGVIAFELRTARQRRVRRREDLGAPVDPAALDASPEAALVARDLEAAAASLLGTLRPADVEVLQLAARGERPPGPTFRKRLERALTRFRFAWRATHGTD